jgi:hypothetical protein
MVVRIAADLLRYCAHKKNPFETVMREAEALYHFNPLDLVPYVLAEDPNKIAELQNKFSITQDQAVDMIIEFTDLEMTRSLDSSTGEKGRARSAFTIFAAPCVSPSKTPPRFYLGMATPKLRPSTRAVARGRARSSYDDE